MRLLELIIHRHQNEQIWITYPGTGNNSQFTYDGYGHTVNIVETVSGSVTGTKQYVWCGDKMCEARNASSTLLNQYFPLGETISATNYFYTTDHLGSDADVAVWESCLGLLHTDFDPEGFSGSIRELTNTSGVVQAQYAYDPCGRVTQLQVGLVSDFQYAGYYFHAPSGLSLAVHRAYQANTGRWINHDPVEEDGGINMYLYMLNNPTWGSDPLGLLHIPFTNFCGENYSSGHSGYPYGEGNGDYPREGDDLRKGTRKGLFGPLDACCRDHDDCMNAAHHVSDSGQRKQDRKCCDKNLAKCAAATGIGLGLGVGFEIKSFLRGPGSYIGPY
jgi:RHS repeat-associated protein